MCFLCQVLIYGGLELILLLLKTVIESYAPHHWERQKCSEILAKLMQFGNQCWDSVSPSHCGTCWNHFNPLNFAPTDPRCLLCCFTASLRNVILQLQIDQIQFTLVWWIRDGWTRSRSNTPESGTTAPTPTQDQLPGKHNDKSSLCHCSSNRFNWF